MTERIHVAVVGGGEWGQALALAASRTGCDVTLISRQIKLHHATSEIRLVQNFATIHNAQLIVLAVPSNVANQVVMSMGNFLHGGHLVVHGIRGIDPNGLETISDVIRRNSPVKRIGALGGPVQVDELLEKRPSAMVIGAVYDEVRKCAQQVFSSHELLIETSSDLKGLEWCSALVGCLSIGIGFAEAAGAGPGLLAALIARAVKDAASWIGSLGFDERTMFGLGGYGDLLASIALPNRPEVQLGRLLAKATPLPDALVAIGTRIEAVTLIPRILEYNRQQRLKLSVFASLGEMLSGAVPRDVLKKMFAAV